MKWLICISFFLITGLSRAQVNTRNFPAIDYKMSTAETPDLDSLSRFISNNYAQDIDKARAIFSWIAAHIAYNTGIYGKRVGIKFIADPVDTVSVWKSGIEMTADRVFRRRLAVCDGYAKLFKTLCDYTGLRCEIINGYAKCFMERSEKFRTNHSWNAVMIDSSWYLVDPTWGSGYVNFANEYVAHTDESYFMASPKQFILEHYPEDLRWTLMDNPPALKEFQHSPFKYKSFVKYGISGYSPSYGLIEASVGDTIRIEVSFRDREKNKSISSDPFFDSTLLSFSPASVFLAPGKQLDKAEYTYIIPDDHVEWLNILYNEDMILRYKLQIKNKGLRSAGLQIP
jgi:transglutaminase/protease-like cytokinesis protein 3